jgi:type VI secretion system protein ImpH
MAREGGEAVHPLIRALEEQPFGFSFFQAVRLLEQAHPDASRIGGVDSAAREAVRLRPSTSLAFPTADVMQVERREGGGPAYRMTTPVLGLYGSASPLPAFYSEQILRHEIEREHDPVRLFLDILNHRLLSLLYRAWSKYRWEFTFEPGAEDRTSQQMMSFLGLATEGLSGAVGVPAGRLLRYSGTTSLRPKGALVIAGLISDYFGEVPVRIEQCVGRWVPVGSLDQNRIGRENSTLSVDLTVGETVRDRAGKCRVVIGPMDLPTFESFLPDGCYAGPLSALARYALPDPLVYDLRLVIQGESVPWLRLSSGPEAARLGWTSWVRFDPESPDKGEIFPAPPLRHAA